MVLLTIVWHTYNDVTRKQCLKFLDLNIAQ